MSKLEKPVGKIFIVGIGPGSSEHQTRRAEDVVKESGVIVGYHVYLSLIRGQTTGKQVISSGMGKERERCAETIRLACSGEKVSIVSSGDPGVYGMAGIILELLEKEENKPEVEIVPGVTASSAAAAILGAPLMHDYAVISLSDILTGWDVIQRRIHAACEADFIICLYNPKSRKRKTQFEEAVVIMGRYKKPETPVGIVRNAGRENETRQITTLSHILDFPVDMFSTVIIGNSTTRTAGKWMITPRGYNL